MLHAAAKSSISSMAKVAEEFLLHTRPDMLVLHDYGVTLGLLGLMRAQRKDPTFVPRIVLFNGVLRTFNIWQARHPFWIQFTALERLKLLIQKQKADFDPALVDLYPEVKRIYRRVIFFGILTGIRKILRLKSAAPINLSPHILILASLNDPFIPAENLEELHRDLLNSKIEYIDYRHFPYCSTHADILKNRINQFETENI
jgi:pimeloyl-ACP methyl ester carboxylesterase